MYKNFCETYRRRRIPQPISAVRVSQQNFDHHFDGSELARGFRVCDLRWFFFSLLIFRLDAPANWIRRFLFLGEPGVGNGRFLLILPVLVRAGSRGVQELL